MKPRTLNKPAPRNALLYAVALTLGVAGRLGNNANGQSVGTLFAVVGTGGLAWWGWQLWQWGQAKRAQEEEARRRTELQTARRERSETERARRDKERETQENAAAKLREVRDAERRAETERMEAETLLRLERDQKSEAEAERLRSLDDTRFLAEVVALFAARGYRVEPASETYPGDLHLVRPESPKLTITRCLPAHREATVSDGNALEAWRMETGADTAYLISQRGFSPELVRLAKNRRLLLIEPILLAAWKQQPTNDQRPTTNDQ